MGMQKYQTGFTLIEVILFLAISGALALGVFATSTVGINNQRYNDAVNSFKSLVQEEFVNTTRVINNRQTNSTLCGALTNIAVGASECVVMGRLMTVSDSGEITRTNLVGRSNGTNPPTDVDVIKSYQPMIDTASQATGSLNWGTTIRKAGTSQPVSIVVFRSPQTGNLLSYVKYNTLITTQSELKTFMDDTDAFVNDQNRIICIDPAGWTMSQTQAVIITARASGPSGVEQRISEGSECD